MRVPSDPALPTLGLLLDPDAMRAVLERSLARSASVGEPRIARVAYKPGLRVVVHYELPVDGRGEHAVAFAQAGRDLGRRARAPDLLRLAHRVDGRSPAACPVSYDASAGALVTWLPIDPRLIALAESPRRLAERLARAGVTAPPAEPIVVPESYKPGVRIVLRLGRHVLKAYGSERAYERGAAGLRLAASLPLRAPPMEAHFPELHLTAQPDVGGSTPSPEAAAARAGALVRCLQTARLEAPRRATPELLLALAAEKAAIVARVLPSLAPRLARLLEELRRSAPPSGPLVLAHGDFDADQLLEDGGDEPFVIDFDDVCLAAPALDLATYLADVARGGEADGERLAAVRAPLLAGYGAPAPGLDWHLAAVVTARALHPFQRAARYWEERTARVVRTAEETLAS